MNRLQNKANTRMRRKNRIRSTVTGTSERPRLSISVSITNVSAQIIDDSKHHTVASVSTIGQKNTGTSLTEKAAWVGTQIAKKAKSAKVNKVVFDRNGRKYHGRVKALADAAREAGLEF